MARSRVVPDLTPAQVARALGYASVGDFVARKDEYERAGLVPDRISGLYDPEGFERWRRLRMASLYPELTQAQGARDAKAVFEERLRRRG
jgi:hypothetical protein